MNDPKKRILLAIADAHFRVGLAFFLCAVVIVLYSPFIHRDPPRACGVVDQPELLDPNLPTGAALVEYQRGEKLFKANCAACHKPDKDMTAPALKGAKDRWEQNGGDIYAWVKNSQGYLQSSGDSYAKALFAKWKNSIMTPNAVSNEDIDAILSYVNNYQRPVIAYEVIQPGQAIE